MTFTQKLNERTDWFGIGAVCQKMTVKTYCEHLGQSLQHGLPLGPIRGWLINRLRPVHDNWQLAASSRLNDGNPSLCDTLCGKVQLSRHSSPLSPNRYMQQYKTLMVCYREGRGIEVKMHCTNDPLIADSDSRCQITAGGASQRTPWASQWFLELVKEPLTVGELLRTKMFWLAFALLKYAWVKVNREQGNERLSIRWMELETVGLLRWNTLENTKEPAQWICTVQ